MFKFLIGTKIFVFDTDILNKYPKSLFTLLIKNNQIADKHDDAIFIQRSEELAHIIYSSINNNFDYKFFVQLLDKVYCLEALSTEFDYYNIKPLFWTTGKLIIYASKQNSNIIDSNIVNNKITKPLNINCNEIINFVCMENKKLKQNKYKNEYAYDIYINFMFANQKIIKKLINYNYLDNEYESYEIITDNIPNNINMNKIEITNKDTGDILFKYGATLFDNKIDIIKIISKYKQNSEPEQITTLCYIEI